MRSPLSFVAASLAVAEVISALPRDHEIRSSVDILDSVLVFDAPAFEDPAVPGNTLVELQAYVSTRELDLGPLLSGISSLLESIGLDIGDAIDTVADRLALFGTIGLSGKDVTAKLNGCSSPATLSATASGGVTFRNVSVGACGSTGATILGKVSLSAIDSRNVDFTVFPSSATGFGVISDIDDTVKISHTLDTLLLAKATLIDTPEPVAGMPDLYASLASSLSAPQFIYITGSPFQLYPFLRDFIDTTYAASSGPIFLQNLTTTNLTDIINFAQSSGIFEYKSAVIDRIHGMYPGKKYLTIGDSTQKDPETYAEAIRKYGDDFIACAWIRLVDGANNTDARFAAAFAGVSPSKYKLYTDDEIPSLAEIDVAGGACS
ncbi:hypothetical protein B0H10DRAFT_1227777 [Mycena sp. CBHHK59/15]|nr:hypothetical protein B0H10DRAFT_1227777 [Mycena sp. CBHHK59/15]